MSVIVIAKFGVPASTLEELANGKHRDLLMRVAEDGKAKGAVHHQFMEDTDGSLLVLDEWESEEAFHSFFDGQKELPALFADAGVTGPPTSTSYRILSTPDTF
jgi:hypothetical protein